VGNHPESPLTPALFQMPGRPIMGDPNQGLVNESAPAGRQESEPCSD